MRTLLLEAPGFPNIEIKAHTSKLRHCCGPGSQEACPQAQDGDGTGRFHASAEACLKELRNGQSPFLLYLRAFASPKGNWWFHPGSRNFAEKKWDCFLITCTHLWKIFWEAFWERNPLVDKEEKFFVDRDIPSNKMNFPKVNGLEAEIKNLGQQVWLNPWNPTKRHLKLKSQFESHQYNQLHRFIPVKLVAVSAAHLTKKWQPKKINHFTYHSTWHTFRPCQKTWEVPATTTSRRQTTLPSPGLSGPIQPARQWRAKPCSWVDGCRWTTRSSSKL